MALDLSYVLITPYSLLKSRTGGILARLLSRTELELVGARMLAFTREMADRYAASIENEHPGSRLLADYIRTNFPPAADGARPRTMLLLFRGERAGEQLRRLVGDLPRRGAAVQCGETLRDTYADVVMDPRDPETVRYFEPAVLTPNDDEAARRELAMLAEFADAQPNLIDHSVGSTPEDARTLVMIKPDNWRCPSSRPGGVIGMLSRTGLRIVGCKIYHMTVADALKFYGPVRDALREKLAPKIAAKARTMLEEAFHLALPDSALPLLAQSVGVAAADDEFSRLVEFMSGCRPENCPENEAATRNSTKCMVLIYEGQDPIAKIRRVLGPTDPAKAPGGTVRRDFGSNVMVNAAHASDAPESVVRESAIVGIDRNDFAELIRAGLQA